jgi:hypothetical protein
MTVENLLSPGRHPGIEVSVETGPAHHSKLGGISPDQHERRCLNRQEKERIDTIETTRAA